MLPQAAIGMLVKEADSSNTTVNISFTFHQLYQLSSVHAELSSSELTPTAPTTDYLAWPEMHFSPLKRAAKGMTL
jgi:hypothetical protein